MTHSPEHVLAQMLVDLSLGTVGGGGGAWPIFYSNEPDTPDALITTYKTPDRDHGRAMIDGSLLGPFGFQVRVRAKNHATGWSKAEGIQETLASKDQVYQRTVHIEEAEYFVHACVGIGDVLAIGKETPTSSRRIFTINGFVYIREL